MRLPTQFVSALHSIVRLRTRAWLIACPLVAIAFVALCIAVVLAMHSAAVQRTHKAASDVATVGARDIARVIEQFDNAIQITIERLQRPDLPARSETMRNLALFDRAVSLAPLAFINVLDEDGRVTDSPELFNRGSGWQGRDYFTAQRANPALGLYVGRTFGQDEYAGVTLSRRISHPDGTFAGVVVAGLRLSYLRTLLDALQVGPHGTVRLLRSDGMVLMSQPFDRNDIGRFVDVQASTDQLQHGIVQRTIDNLPLLIRVGVTYGDMADGQEDSVTMLLAGAVGVAFVSFGTAIALRRERHRREIAERDNRNKSDYLAMVSHELRTPLQSILRNAEQLRNDDTISPMNTRMLTAIVTAGDHLRGIIDRVLNYLQIELRVPTPRMGQVDLPELLDQCCIVVESDIVGRGLGIHYGFKVEAPEQFITDGELLRQTLLNLLSNAVKFTDKGEISIEVSGSSDRITIEVKDTGCGIPPMQRHKLFKRGERLGAENSAIPGYGIGLAMAQRLVKAMSGDIGYRENQGGGSIFWISLPAGATAEAMPILGVAQHELMVSDTP